MYSILYIFLSNSLIFVKQNVFHVFIGYIDLNKR